MTSPYPDARAWAQDQSLANTPRLARLEGVAFQAHPDIVATFGADGASMARVAASRPRGAGRTATDLVVGVVGAIAALAPLLGVAIYGWSLFIAPSAEPVQAQVAVPISAVCFTIAATTQLVLWIVWLRGGAHWSSFLFGVAVVTAVLAGFATIGLPTVSQRDGFDLGGWVWPAWIALALAAALAVAQLVRFRSRRPEPVLEPLPSPPNVSDRERARMLVRELPDAERRAVQSDRDAALRILAHRGLLDEPTLDRALAADLGTLFTLDPVRGG